MTIQRTGPDGIQSFSGQRSSLLNGLLAFWKIEEAATADRVDEVGNPTTPVPLTDPTSVAAGTGHIGNGAVFLKASSDRLRTANTSSGAEVAYLTPETFTWAGWVKVDDIAADQVFWGTNVFGKRSTKLYYRQTTNNIRWETSSDGSASSQTVGTFVPTATEWFFILCGYDHANTERFIQIGTTTTLNAIETASWTGPVFTPDERFYVGNIANAGALNGMVDALGAWNRRLIAAEITNLWNGGTGREYPFT